MPISRDRLGRFASGSGKSYKMDGSGAKHKANPGAKVVVPKSAPVKRDTPYGADWKERAKGTTRSSGRYNSFDAGKGTNKDLNGGRKLIKTEKEVQNRAPALRARLSKIRGAFKLKNK